MLLMVLGVNSFSQSQPTKFFIGSKGDYSILINENVTTKHNDNQDGGYVDYYILRENNSFTFMLSVTRVVLPSPDPNLIYTEDYRKTYLTECSCNILDYRKTTFSNFTGMKFKIKSDLNGSIVNGFSVSTISSGILFNINFLALETKFNTLTPEYEKMINSLVFK